MCHYGGEGTAGNPAEIPRTEAVHSHELRLLRLIAGDAPLQEVLDELCLSLQSLSSQPLGCAVMMADASRDRIACIAAPAMPEAFRRDSTYSIAAGTSACARAIRDRQPVIVADTEEPGVAEDVLARRRRDGYRAVWSYPILQNQLPLGTLVLLPDQPGRPTEADEHLIEFGVQVARLALAHEHAQQALRKSEGRFRDFTEMAADWYWEQDAEFRFSEVTYGPGSRPASPPYYDQDVVGRHRWDLPYVNVPEGFWDEHRRLLAAGRPFSGLHLQRRTSDGGIRHVEISGRPLFDDQGGVAGYRGVGRDITARLEAEKKAAEAREWLQQAVRAAHLGLWERDVDSWEFRYANDWKPQLGYGADEIGNSATQFDSMVHPDDLERVHAVARAYVANPVGDYENEFRLRHKDGTWRRVLSRGAVIVDPATGRRRWMGCHVDITEHKQLLEALRTSEEDYRALFMSNPHPMIIFNQENLRIIDINTAACAHYGYSHEEFLALTTADIRPPEEVARFRQFVSKIAAEQHVNSGPWPHLKKDGTIFLADISSSLIRHGGRNARICLVRDVTEQVRAEEQVRELNATLEERVRARTAELEGANTELDAFNYSVSHDLRAPLRSVDGFSQALLDEYAQRLDDTGLDYLRRIRAAAQRMGELIDAMYHLSKLSRSLLQIRELNLSAVAHSVNEEFRQADPARDIEVHIGQDITAEGDPGLLRVVLTNLLGNAWKYTSRSTRSKIEFGARIDDAGTVVYSVRDNGVGFDMRFSGKLFTLFQRLHREEEFGGHGVGLATVQRIVRRHGGRIWAEAEKGRGATFYFTLWDDATVRREAEDEILRQQA